MERIANVTEAQRRLEERLNYYTARIEAWEKVERIHKKDGEDFAILSKNFTNCKLIEKYHNQELTVYFRTDKEGYTTDYINLGGNVYTHEEPADTADKIEKRIADKIAIYNGYIETTKRGLETIDEQIKAISPELETLKKAIAEADKTDCKYILMSYIKESLNIFF